MGFTSKIFYAAALLYLLLAFAKLEAQVKQNVLPDTPSAVAPPQKSGRVEHRELLADDPYSPLTRREKVKYWERRTIAPYTFVSAGLSTLYDSATGDFRYCCGAGAWGKQYAAAVADTEARYFFGNLVFPTLLKQDPRYLPKRKGGIAGRAWYAATRVLVARNDDGRNTFNTSEILAVGFSQALRNAYYPDRDRTLGRTTSSIFGTLQGDAGGYLLKEFMPDLKRIFKAHAPKRVQSLTAKLPNGKLSDGEESSY